MTPDHDIERVLEHWFAEGPTRPADHFLGDTLDRLDGPLVRRRAGLPTRSPAVKKIDLRFAAAAAGILLIAGIGLTILGRAPAVGTDPSPSPTASLPTTLPSSWRSVGTRPMPGGNGLNQYDIVIDATTVTIHAIKGDVLSSVALVGPDTLELRVLSTPVNTASPGTQWDRLDWHCRVGDTGTYTFSPSSPGSVLTLAPVRDSCAPRAGILAGDWDRTDIGALASGRHEAKLFRPFGNGVGRFSYTVPLSWTDANECADCYMLTSLHDLGGLGIELLTDVVPYSFDGVCDVTGVGRTPAAITTWLATLPNLPMTAPTSVTIGGLSGLMVDVTIGPTHSSGCDFGRDESGSGTGPLADQGAPDQVLNVQDTGGARWFLLDRGDGRTLLVAVANRDKTIWEAGLAAAMPIVDSFEFVR